MAGRRKKGLTPDDRDLWARVAKTATPLNSRPAKIETPPKEIFDKPKPKTTAKPIEPFQLGAKAKSGLRGHVLTPSISESVAKDPLRMDHRTHGKMLRGKLKPEARIDLHGMTVAEAHPALTSFIFEAHERGLRLVLVITGKGKDRADDGPMPVRRGVLKHNVPTWLKAPPLGRMVLNVRESHLRHGGSGAYYVYLKKSR